MATSRCSALALAVLLQVPAAPPDSVAVLRARIARDSTDAQAWLLLGRAYLRLGDEARDSAWARAALDTAEQALTRAATLLGPLGSSAPADSARVLRVAAWSARSRLAWARGGNGGAGDQAWGPAPPDLRVPPVLEELGENLLRACPTEGVLLTTGEADSYAAWYMQFARGLRPDLLVMPLAAWRSDSLLRVRLAADLKLDERDDDGWLAQLAKRRSVCVTMGVDRAPEPKRRVKWQPRPLVWVAGPVAKGERVPPRDFVFAALRMALDRREAWAQPALALYARAARATPALCQGLRTFKLAADIPTCRR